ncbi:aliphatic sulfonate ABC transporter substrate-binding protein [Heyndrickxia vini]|uniref:Aliphatic sulfonate ABC transporter substrate-binding protein n=1 Tax=Heyndrickxia vini TaxID=1476025 RepID=A0ABX7E038_9BACI|nr:aliphatic sulfonate ABC transporter substrate-binding protein [Heyndrickxia vini]QQZ08882.1 aliphatic sulfonate ABC transporter substrate-binding protein [Heyndrickxia vini]
MKKYFIFCLSIITIFGVLSGCSSSASGENKKPKKIILDYAFYSPTSLVLKNKGFAEKLFKKEGIDIEFVLSQGSNKALEFLNSKSVDFSSSAGAAALMAKANGSPIQSIYIYSKPEWTALVTLDPSIQSVADLIGKKVAATIGTDPYIFLLRALKENGLSPNDIEIVNLQHSDGASALQSGEVTAWAGLDPHMAKLELESKANLFYRQPNYNSYGTLNVRKEFADQYPKYVEKVIEAYEQARKWAIEHPDETAGILAKEAKIDSDVAKKELERNDFSSPTPGNEQVETIQAAGKILQEMKVLKDTLNIEKLVNELITPKYAKKVINQ